MPFAVAIVATALFLQVSGLPMGSGSDSGSGSEADETAIINAVTTVPTCNGAPDPAGHGCDVLIERPELCVHAISRETMTTLCPARCGVCSQAGSAAGNGGDGPTGAPPLGDATIFHPATSHTHPPTHTTSVSIDDGTSTAPVYFPQACACNGVMESHLCGSAVATATMCQDTLLVPLFVYGYQNVTCQDLCPAMCNMCHKASGCHGWNELPNVFKGMIFFAGVVLCAVAYQNGMEMYTKKQMSNEECAYGRAHPITVRTLDGDTYTLEDWAMCKDLKTELHKLAPSIFGLPETFQLVGDLDSTEVNRAIQTKLNTDDRMQMLLPATMHRLRKMWNITNFFPEPGQTTDVAGIPHSTNGMPVYIKVGGIGHHASSSWHQHHGRGASASGGHTSYSTFYRATKTYAVCYMTPTGHWAVTNHYDFRGFDDTGTKTAVLTNESELAHARSSSKSLLSPIGATWEVLESTSNLHVKQQDATTTAEVGVLTRQTKRCAGVLDRKDKGGVVSFRIEGIKGEHATMLNGSYEKLNRLIPNEPCTLEFTAVFFDAASEQADRVIFVNPTFDPGETDLDAADFDVLTVHPRLTEDDDVLGSGFGGLLNRRYDLSPH